MDFTGSLLTTAGTMVFERGVFTGIFWRIGWVQHFIFVLGCDFSEAFLVWDDGNACGKYITRQRKSRLANRYVSRLLHMNIRSAVEFLWISSHWKISIPLTEYLTFPFSRRGNVCGTSDMRNRILLCPRLGLRLADPCLKHWKASCSCWVVRRTPSIRSPSPPSHVR